MAYKRFNVHLTLITALLLVLIAGLAGSTLVLLHRMHRNTAHTAAAEVVIQQGKTLAKQLAMQPSVRALPSGSPDWREFSRLVNSLHTLEGGIQYVSVSRDNVVVFHEQTRLLDGRPLDAPESSPPEPADMHREVLHVGNESIPVVVFNTHAPNDHKTEVRVALRKDTVNREEQAANTAIVSMFRLTLLTVIVSFAICVILVVWMMRREVGRERQRRKEEHLAFSGMLANGIVHDFRNPMSSLRLDAQMLQRESNKGSNARPDRIEKLAVRTRNTLDRMDKVFQEFLYSSRPDRDERTELDLVACVRDSLEMLTPRFERAHVTYTLSTSHDRIDVQAYESSLRRAIVNVLTNAEQFSPPNESIVVTLSRTTDRAMLTISDNGPGIPKNMHKQVFEMFETGRPEGTGLGLFLAKTAIERSGGNIDVVDEPGSKGTCIRISLPCSPPSKQEPEYHEPST